MGRLPGSGAPPELTLTIDHNLLVRLRPAAVRRDVPIRRLIIDLLDAVATGGLVDAVLDVDTVSDD